ncbi:MAG: hypothetical protein WBB19_17565 [Desulforhopalus sp.]
MNILRFFLISMFTFLLTSTVMAKDPYKAANNSWISLNGTVVASSPTAFELDYGTGTVIVEMDGWSWYSGTHSIMEGDQVTVHGRVDDDLYEMTSIEADSVYVKGLNTYFYANSLDEEDRVPQTAILHPDTGLQLQGTITSKSGREFTINTGSREVKIDTINMLYNPLDDKGYQKLKIGDFVQVTGKLDVDFFEKTEIMADTVTTLFKDTKKKQKK